MAGLCAGWRLAKRELDDFVILEMEGEAGGNSRWGEHEISAYPWGAHYVPVPGKAAGLVREIFTDLGVFDGRVWDERHLVHAPAERLFIHGRWQEGFEPAVGPTRRRSRSVREVRRAHRRLARDGALHDPDGRRAGRRAARQPRTRCRWRRGSHREGLDSPWLRWMVDYACRDDYGGLAGDVSAWAGLLYFAARDADDAGPLTWPEGNGWIVRRLLQRLGARVHTACLTYRVERQGRRWRVLTPHVAWTADVVIMAAPLHVATRIVDGARMPAVTSSPWVTANLTLDRWPRESGFPVAWDNVIFDSPALGYVVATHQQLRRHVPRTVWTYYWALAHLPAVDARRWLLAQDYRLAARPDSGRPRPCPSRSPRLRLPRRHHALRARDGASHAGPARQPAVARPADGHDRLFYAHSDLSGLPLFEEAQYRGVLAADRALRVLRGG